MTVPIPTAHSFYAIVNEGTHEVVWFELDVEDAKAKALLMSSLPEYKDITLVVVLCGREGLDA
jgi:hypothetical protein